MKSIHHLPREQQQKFIQCPHCNEYIELSHINNVVKHAVGNCFEKKQEQFYLKIVVIQPFEEMLGDHTVNLN